MGLRILFVNTARGGGGGITSALELSAGLGARGHDVTVACHPRSGIHDGLRVNTGVDVVSLPMRAELNPWRIVQLARIASHVKPDVVLADRRKDVKLSVAVSRLAGRAADFPVVHRHGAPSVLRDSPMYRAIWSRLRLMIVNSRWMSDALLGATPWLGRIEMRVIPNGKDPARYRPMPERRAAMRSSLGVPLDAFIVCYHGVLQERKRVDVLLRALELLPTRGNVHALITGSGPADNALREAARGLPVTFTGPRRDIPDVLAAADVAVHMSEAEGFSNSVLEAMACGMPVIASNTTSHPEQVVDGVSGFLVAPADAAAVAERLAKLVAEPELIRSASACARQRVLDHFTLDRMLDAYEAALMEASGR
ncbi:MAG: glycosyltransferase family 4 protein [Longimicrobiales bacterium]